MSDEIPPPLERAANEEPAPATPVKKPSRTASIVVLFVAAAAAVVVASLSTSNSAPRAAASPPARVDGASSTPVATAPAAPQSRDGLAQPSAVPRRRDPSPFDAPTTDSAVAACVAEVRANFPYADSIEVQEKFGDVDPTQGRADSLIVEGRVDQFVWHCASSRRQDGAIYNRNVAIEHVWNGAPGAFLAVHALTTAAEESCMRQVSKLYPGYSFRGVKREQRGETLYVSGDAFPLDPSELVREFGCSAEIRDGRVADARAKKSK